MAGPTPPPLLDPHVGRKLGKYEILTRLSTGGMSQIFLAFQRGLGGFRKIVVLKQILPDIKGEEEFVRMFLDEAKITAMFAHPNIAQVFDLDIDDGELFLAMEFVPGATLVEVARACRQASEPIPMGFTLLAVRDTALALHYAHSFTDPAGRALSVIHRDIAEKNIMVTYEGVTKLLDFGIAKNPNWSSRTTVGMVKGTSGYMSPEQITGQKLDTRSDIFSLGVVLHECLTGMRLFPSKNTEDGMLAVLREDAPPPSRQNRSVPPELDAIVAMALQRNRDDRYGTALELAREIDRGVGDLLWLPEQCGALIQRFFSDRRDQTRKLLEDNTGERTGELQLSDLLSKPGTPAFEAPPTPPRAKQSSEDAQTDPAAKRPRVSGARPKRSMSSSDVAVALEPKTVLEVPPSMKHPMPAGVDVDTVPGRSKGEWSTDNVEITDSIGDPGSGMQTARRAAVRRSALPLLLVVLFALGLAAGGLWFWNPLVITELLGSSSVAPPAPPEAPPAEPPKPPEKPAAPALEKPPAGKEDAVVRLSPTPDDEHKVPTAEAVAVHPPAAKKAPAKSAADSRDRRRKPHEAQDEAAKTARATADNPAAAAAPGQLSLTTDPAATVIFQAQDLGQTPLDHRAMPAGTHMLKLIGPDGHSYRLPVDISSGKTTSVNVSLSSLASE